MLTLREDRQRKDKGKGKSGDGSKGHAKGKGKTVKRHGKEGNGHIWEYPRETSREKREVGDDKDSAGHAARSDTSRQNVAGKSHASMRKMQTAEKSGEQPESEEDGEVGGVLIAGNVDEVEEEEETSDTHTHTRRRHRPPRVPIQVLGWRRST